MVQTFKKGVSQYLGRYREWFSSDFDCRCKYPDCQTTILELDLVTALEDLSDLLGRPRINCGFRCRKHNLDVGGMPDSQHPLGKAVDVSSGFSTPNEIYLAAEKIPAFKNGGMGLYKSFVHLDVRGTKARWGLQING